MKNQKAKSLIKKYLLATATSDEEALLETWYINTGQNQQDIPGEPDYPKIENEILKALREEQLNKPKIKQVVMLWRRIAAAASILLFLSIGGYFIFHKTQSQQLAQIQPVKNDILPGSTKATLTLANGQKIILNNTQTGNLAQQGNTSVKAMKGQVIYNTNQIPSANGGAEAQAYNTLTTKAGEQYPLVLADGTKVWLNAKSSITYPVVFSGNERKVAITGEVYFEITHNAGRPFKVTVRDETVEDIGTHFNINAYDDEPVMSTTLLEGSVRVIKGTASAILAPGQQAILNTNSSLIKVKDADLDEAVAWKNGYFYFDGADVRTVMRQFARWYNVEVAYEGNIPKKTFRGKVYRNINASQALGILSYFNVHFRIAGRKIIVTS